MSSNFYASYSSGMGGVGGGGGTVTSVSVVTADGFAGIVANPTTTPAITISTTVTGLLQGNGTSISTATTGNLTDVGIDGITITGGTGAVLGSGASVSQHVSDTTHNGYLSSTDWNTFNGKQPAITTGNLTDSGTDGISVTGGTGAVIGSGAALAQQKSDATHNGYLSSTDWATFNGKQATLTLGNLVDAGTDGIVITGGTGAVVGSGTSIAQHVADTTHSGYLSSTDWNTFNGKGTGTVTSVSMTVPTFLSVSGSPVTSSGTLGVSLSGTALPVVNGGTGVTTSTGSGNNVLSTSPTLVTPVLGTPASGNLSNCTNYPNVTQSVAGLVTSAGQLLGTNTNDSASSGNVGEFLSNVPSGSVAVAGSGGGATLATITLTAGDWDIWGVAELGIGTATLLKELDVIITATNSTSLTGATSTRDSSAVMYFPGGVGSTVVTEFSPSIATGPLRLTVANGNTKQLWLVGVAVYTTAGTAFWSTSSILQARRRR